jgi:hypothetical protein
MAQIEVKYDPTLELEPIQDIMYNTSKYEPGDDSVNVSNGEVEQTKITGIAAPLVKINDITINFTQIKSFNLSCKGFLPTLNLCVYDMLGLTKQLDHPKGDNLVRIEILPPFEDVYKKVNLRFYITNFQSEGDLLYLTCKYNVSELYRNRLEAWGEMSTYQLADKIAKDSKLGLASNVSEIDDKRYMYCRNQSFIDKIEEEIVRSGVQKVTPQCWIDWHNYVNIVDMWERYQSTDEIGKVWSMPDYRIDTENGEDVKPIQFDAIISNNLDTQYSQLNINDYEIVNNIGKNVTNGTDKIVEIYNCTTGESASMLIQDGDAKKDTFVKTIYMGECFGDSNFQLQTICRDMAIQKMYGQCIRVCLSSPLLGLERGGKVDLRWYDSTESINEVKKDNDITTTVAEETENPEPDLMILNKSVSGQYLILETNLSYEGNGIKKMQWKYELLLGRPADQIKTYGEDAES